MSIEVEWVIVADYAEIIGNKLYVQGGGWDRLTVNSAFPTSRLVGLAVSFSIPWDETNQRHPFKLEVMTEDGSPAGRLEGQLEVGRPAGVPAGQAQRSQIAANITMKFDQEATFVVIASADGEELRRVPFNVVAGPNIRHNQQQPGAS